MKIVSAIWCSNVRGPHAWDQILQIVWTDEAQDDTYSGKRGELVKQFYLNDENADETLQIYRRNHKLRRGACFVIWKKV